MRWRTIWPWRQPAQAPCPRTCRCGREQQPHPCVAAADGVRGMHVMILLAAPAAWRTRSDPCQALPSCRMWTCQQCRRGSRRRRRRSQQTSLGCRPSRSGRDREVKGAFATHLAAPAGPGSSAPFWCVCERCSASRTRVSTSQPLLLPVSAELYPHCCLAATNQSSCPPSSCTRFHSLSLRQLPPCNSDDNGRHGGQ